MKRLACSVLVFGFALGACAPASRSTLPKPDRETIRQFSDYMRQFEYDYDAASTPAELAKEADVVVTGTIVAVAPGQSYRPAQGDRAVIATSVLELKVDRILAGDGALSVDGSIYIEVPHPAYVGTGSEGGELVPFDQAAFAATVPKAYGIFFLDDRTEEPYWDTVVDAGAGRPSATPITSAFVQGFLIEDVNGELVSVTEPLELMSSTWQGLKSVDEVVALVSPAA